MHSAEQDLAVPTPPRRQGLRAEALGAAAVALLSTVLSFLATGLRPGQLRQPIVNGDLFYYYATVRGLIDNGWYLDNPSLGAPYGQDLARFPAIDQTHYLAMKVLSIGSSDPILVTNAYYLLGFPLAGACAYLFFRLVGLRRRYAVPLAVSYAILPLHTLNVAHVMLSAYWVVPLGMSMVWVVANGSWSAFVESLSGRRRIGVQVLAAVLGVVVALGGVYYSIMLSALLLLALALRRFESKTWRRPSLLLSASVVVTTLLALVVTQLMLQSATAPEDVDGFVRQPGAAELLGGKLTHLLLPWSQTPLIGGVRERYDADALLASPEPTFFGLVASAGVWLCLALLLWRALTARPLVTTESRVLARLAGLTALLTLAYVATGLGALVAQVVPELRGWNRFSVFLALTATAAVGIALQSGIVELQARRPLPAAPLVAAALLSLVVVTDQARGFPKPLSYKVEGQAQRQLQASRAAMAQLDAAVTPTDCPMAQYPHRRFPEGGSVPPQIVYDELVTYLAGTARPISYGGVKGSLAGDWPGLLDDSSATRLVNQLAGSGFCVLEVMDDALVTEQQMRTRAGLEPVVGAPVAQDRVNHRAYFDLRAARQRLDPAELEKVRDGALRPVRVNLDPITSTLRGAAGSEFFEVTDPRTALRLFNTSDRPRHVRLTLSIASADERPVSVDVAGQRRDVGRTYEPVTLDYDLAGRAGTTATITADGPGDVLPGRTAYARVRIVSVEFDRGQIG